MILNPKLLVVDDERGIVDMIQSLSLIHIFPNLTVDPATIDEIVVFTSKKGDDYE